MAPEALKPGDLAPDFNLPAADREGRVSLASYRGRSPVLLTLFRGLYCPFCRRQMAQLSPTADRLRAVGIETVGVVATAAERARVYFRANPARFPLAADPELATHRAYGLEQFGRDERGREMVEVASQRIARELGIIAAPGEGRQTIDRLDGFAQQPSDAAERERHQIQMTGQFLVDRDGYLCWCHTEGRGNYSLFPSTEELLSLAERVG